MSSNRIQNPRVTAERLRRLCDLRPTLAIVLGSGFQSAAAGMEVVAQVPYRKLPGFPRVTVGGHAGNLRVGRMAGTPTLVLSGRAHYYEGYDLEQVTFPIRVLADFGIRALLLTNAAGGINRRFQPGDFMRLSDHINFMGANPLRGPALGDLTQFVDLTETYDAALNHFLQVSAKKGAIRLRTGVYLAVSGPSYETPAEIRAFARLGADVVGMSTVPEAIVARQCGLRVAAVSCITNLAAGRCPERLSHAAVLAEGKKAGGKAARLLSEFARLYGQSA